MKKTFLRIAKFTGNTRIRISFKKETPAQVLFFEFCEIFENTFFAEHFRATVFDTLNEIINNN